MSRTAFHPLLVGKLMLAQLLDFKQLMDKMLNIFLHPFFHSVQPMVRMSKKNSLQWENNRIICSVIDKTYTNIELPYLKWCYTFIILCSEGVIIPTIGIARAFWKMLYVSVLLCMFGWALHIHIVYTIMDCKGYRLIFKYALTFNKIWNLK